VVVEVERVDVLVFLRWVFGVGDGAIRNRGEPFRMLSHPGVVGGALQGKVERDLQPGFLRRTEEGDEVGFRSEVWMDGVVAALGRADGPRWPGIIRASVEGDVRSIAKDDHNRVDRW